MGTAIHAGLAAHWRRKERAEVENAVTEALRVEWPPDAPSEFSREGLESLALKVLDKVLTWIAVNMPDAEPVMAEQALGTDGHTTPDLVTRENTGPGRGLVVTDWKTSANLPTDKIMYRLQEIDRTWQFLHYCWAVGKHFQEPVARFRKVVIAMGPKILVRSAEFIPSPEMIAAWHKDALAIWRQMSDIKEGRAYAPRNENGCLKYGARYRCQYYEACWTCFGDAKRMENFLVLGMDRNSGSPNHL